MKLKVGATALVFGVVMALLHTIWMIMVYLGVANLYLNWILGLHLVTNPYRVLPFNLVTAVELIVFTFVVGYVFGWVFAYIWNWLHKGR